MPFLRTALLLVSVALLVLLPIVLRPEGADVLTSDAAEELIIITPHNEQIRSEFGPAFSAWHEKEHDQPVNVIFTVPGGTSEIRKMLVAQFEAAAREGKPVGDNADLVFGGGTYEHDRLKAGVTVDGVQHRITRPVDLPDDWLQATYGENHIAEIRLYDPEKYWFGTALSGFGIVYNRDVLGRLGVADPEIWDDLCDPRLRGWVALVNPGQSGSVTTAFEAILQQRGWKEGWRILRRMAANSRYFSASALKPPNDVGRGDAALGVCIDFYGRYQAQAIKVAGGGNRVGYIDPPGQTTIDPDPISMLSTARNPTVARRFIEFCLSEKGQSLWQFRVDDEIDDGLGPRRFELRRLVIRRSMYESFAHRMIDQVNPYETAAAPEYPNQAFRSFIAVLFAAMAMDPHGPLREAWQAIVTHPAYPPSRAIITAADVSDPDLYHMLDRFDQLPTVPGPGGTSYSLGEPGDLDEIKSGWLGGLWAGDGLWNEHDRPEEDLRRRCVRFFEANYRQVVAAGRKAGVP